MRTKLEETIDLYLITERKQKLLRTLKSIACISILVWKEEVIQMILSYKSTPTIQDCICLEKVIEERGGKNEFYKETQFKRYYRDDPEFDDKLILALNHAFDFDEVISERNIGIYPAKLKEGKFLLCLENPLAL